MDLLQKDVPILAKIYEAKCFYDSQNNRIFLYYKNHVTSRTLVDFYNLPTTPPPNSSLYIIYDLQTGIFNVSTNPPTYTVSNSKVYVTSPINAEYDMDKVIIYRISWYEIDTAIDANYILTQLSTFVRKHQADTITATHTFDPTEPGPAFQLGPNARNQLIEYLNADRVDGFHASQTPTPNTIPVANDNGKISIDWLPQGTGSNLNADTVDGFHASQTPTPNTIPVSLSDKKLSEGWTKFGFETYSGLSVGTSFPASPNHNNLFWNSNELKLYKYDARTETWTEIDWKTIVKASPEWQAGRLRINSSTGKLEISPDGTNWYECIPAVGSQTVELATVDNTSFSYKYWIAPGQTVIIRNAKHVPIVYTPIVEPFFEGRYWHSYAYELWIGLRPSNVAISNGDGQYVAGNNSSPVAYRNTSLSIVPILQQAEVAENWGNFVLRIRQNQRWLVNSMGQGWQGYAIIVCNCSGTASTTSYWLGTWYDQDGANFTVEVLVLTRTA